MGLSREEVELLSWREFILRSQAHERTERRQDRRMLQVVNHIRGVVGADPLPSLWGAPSSSPPPSRTDRDALDAMKYRWRHWYDVDATC